jgi:MipA family protein
MNFHLSRARSIAIAKTSLLGLVCLASYACFAQPIPAGPIETVDTATQSDGSDWRISAGAGIISSPKFMGARKQRTIVVPGFDVRYQDWFFANPVKGIGVETKAFTGLTLKAAVGVDTTSRNSKDDPRLKGLEKVNVAPSLTLSADYDIGDFTFGTELSKRIASSKGTGAKLRLEAGYNAIANASLLVMAGVFEEAMDKSYARNFFSVSSSQSNITGLRRYEAKSGALDSGAFLQALYRLESRWLVFSKIDVSRLATNASNSPIVQKKNQTTALLFVSRTF